MSDDILVVSRQGQLADLWHRTGWRVALYTAAAVLLGALGGILWSLLAPRPAYTMGPDLTAYLSERGQAEVVAADVTFTFIAAAIGLVCGIAGWLILYRNGWVVTAVPVLAAFVAGVVVWQVGLLLNGPGLAERMASASAGAVVPVDLGLRSMAALVVGPFAAVTPVMLLAAFWPERPEPADPFEPAAPPA